MPAKLWRDFDMGALRGGTRGKNRSHNNYRQNGGVRRSADALGFHRLGRLPGWTWGGNSFRAPRIQRLYILNKFWTVTKCPGLALALNSGH